jgi:hypothetical protein
LSPLAPVAPRCPGGPCAPRTEPLKSFGVSDLFFTSAPVSELCLTSLPVRFLMSAPVSASVGTLREVTRSVAYELPPSAMKTATVAITLA